MWIATAEHCRTLDHRAANEYHVPSRVLMERAGMAAFDIVRELLPEGGRILVFCGKGNNGGDGFVVARLALEAGIGVECLVAAEEKHLSPDASEQLAVCRASGLNPIFYDDARWHMRSEHACCRDLIVDALLGTGSRCEVRGPVKEAIQAINRSGVPVLSIDVPSGIHCDTGEELGESVWALRTITFGMPKPFIFQGTGLEHAGRWSVAQIGYPNELLEDPTSARVVDRQWVANLLPERQKASHKGDNGTVLIVAGSDQMRGAAVLAAEASLRSGAGLVMVASVRSVIDAVSHQLPEVLLLTLPEKDGAVAASAAEVILEQRRPIDSAVFGPGMGTTEGVREFLSQLWAHWSDPCVVDADAVNLVAEGLSLPDAPCVLTPHPGEMSRLLGISTAEVQMDRFQTVTQAVERTERTVILKGAHSIVGSPDMPMLVNSTGNPGMATGGMGDTLSGVVGTLLAQQLPDWMAAACGMYWHGLAANLCAEEIGPMGYTASEVARRLPRARARISTPCNTDSSL